MRKLFAALLTLSALAALGCTDYEKLDVDVRAQERIGDHVRVSISVTNARGEEAIDVQAQGVNAVASDGHLYSALSAADCPTCAQNTDGTTLAVGETASSYLYFSVPADVDLEYIIVTDNVFVSGDGDSEDRSTYFIKPVISDAQSELIQPCEVRIVARRVDDGRTEFALQQRLPDEEWSDRILPSARFFPETPGHDRWLVSSPIECATVVSQGRLE